MTAATTIKILYNDCYGGFAFSQAFLAEYKAITGRTLDTYKALFRLGPNSIRCDSTAIMIFEEHGSEWCSGPHSAIAVREIPAIFANYWDIEEYDGEENVHVSVDGALADCLHTFMETRDLAALERQYTAIQEAKRSMFRAPLESAEPVDVTPPVLASSEHLACYHSELKQPAESGSNGYSYFGSNTST
jgi:hypothetical protein